MFTTIALREGFSQCLLYSETKSASAYSEYCDALEYNSNYYFVGGGVNDNDESIDLGWYNAMIIKTDRCGNTLWKKFIGPIGTFDNIISDIVYDKGYIYIIGGTGEDASQSTNFIAKLDENGSLIWYKVYRTNNNDISCSKLLIDNEKIIAYGYHEIFNNIKFSFNMYIMEIDTAGNIIKEHEYYPNNGKTTIMKLYKKNLGYMAICGSVNNFRYGVDSVLFEGGTILCKLDDKLGIENIDTLKSQYNTNLNLIDYNAALQKYIIHLSKWISNDSSHRQIAFLDSTGKLEKIIEDPFEQNLTPQNLIAYDSGWVAGLYSILIKYNANYEKQTYIQITRNDTGIFHNNSTTVVKNGKGLLVAGTCRQCNPYDDNSNSPYDRPTAIMIDSNFKDFGKAQAPYEAPKPFAAIKAFPNPALENISLQITESAAEYSIYNSMGMFISAGSMASSTDISLLNMSAGMYIIQLKSPQGNHIGSVKFLKK